MPEKIAVNTTEELEALLEKGVASLSDWEDWVDAITGNGPPWSGYIYPNVGSGSAAVVASGSEIARLISLGSALTEDDFEEFSFCGCPVEFGNTCHDENGRFCGLAGSPSESGPFFTGHKGRSIAVGQKVKVYRNLHKEGVVYSIQDAKTGLVLGHSPSVALKNVTYEVHEAGRLRVVREKKKNVHSFVVGEYAGPFGAAERSAALSGEPVSYNPYKSGSYYSKVDERPVSGADSVIVDKSGVYMHGERKKKQATVLASSSGSWQEMWRSHLEEFANPNHEPAGSSKGGEFAPAPGKRLATAKPSGKGKNAAPYVVGEGARMSLDLISDPAAVVARQAAVPGFEDLAGSKDPKAAIEEIVKRQTANLVDYADRVIGADPKHRTADAWGSWYPFANGYVRDLAKKNGISEEGALAATAALSASAAWQSNVPWAKFLIENVGEGKGPGSDTGKYQTVKPEWAAAKYTSSLASWQTKKEEVEKAGRSYATPMPKASDFTGTVGKQLKDLSDLEVAEALRGKHESTGTGKGAEGKMVTQLGDEVHPGFGVKGAGTVPQSSANLAKAISVLRDPSPETIDKAIGDQNKVRSFYQNLRDPLDRTQEDVTVDTHHLGAANGMPWTVSSEFLNGKDIINTPGNARTGALGTYPIIVESTRRATAQINAKYGTNYTPNQVQSIIWEAHKDYFPPKIRSNKEMQKSIELAHTAFAKGDISAVELRARIEAARARASTSTNHVPTIEELIKKYKEGGV